MAVKELIQQLNVDLDGPLTDYYAFVETRKAQRKDGRNGGGHLERDAQLISARKTLCDQYRGRVVLTLEKVIIVRLAKYSRKLKEKNGNILDLEAFIKEIIEEFGVNLAGIFDILPSSVSRILTQLSLEGIIDIDNKNITVLDNSVLNKQAESIKSRVEERTNS